MKIRQLKVTIAVLLGLLLTLALLPVVAFAQDVATPTAENPVPTITSTPVPPTSTNTTVPATLTPTPTSVTSPPAPVPIPEPVTVILFGTGLAALSAAVASRRNNKDN